MAESHSSGAFLVPKLVMQQNNHSSCGFLFHELAILIPPLDSSSMAGNSKQNPHLSYFYCGLLQL
jgi:hypothetical protein